MSENYIENHYDDIKSHGNVIENRLFDDDLKKEDLISDNKNFQNMCKSNGLPYILIDEKYEFDII